MFTKDKKIDAYINNTIPFAQPILRHIRSVVHKACPQVEEKMKWSFPHFYLMVEMLCSMAALKQHCAFNLWKASLIKNPENIFTAEKKEGMGHLGKITSIKDFLKVVLLTSYNKHAMQLNTGIKFKATKSAEKMPIAVPDYFAAAFNKNKTAAMVFKKFSPSH